MTRGKMKKELAIRIVNLGMQIAEMEDEIQHSKETVKLWKETRDAFLRELVERINAEGE